MHTLRRTRSTAVYLTPDNKKNVVMMFLEGVTRRGEGLKGSRPLCYTRHTHTHAHTLSLTRPVAQQPSEPGNSVTQTTTHDTF